jgi:hypothetical protein
MKADNKQKALVHICKSQLIAKGVIDEAGYRALLRQWFDAESSRDLDYDQATVFIDELIKMGASIKKKRKSKKKLPPDITQLPSPQQLRMIEHFKQDIRWKFSDGFNRWLKAYLKRDRIVTAKEANAVIEALKGMLARQQNPTHPPLAKGRSKEGWEGVECYHDHPVGF